MSPAKNKVSKASVTMSIMRVFEKGSPSPQPNSNEVWQCGSVHEVSMKCGSVAVSIMCVFEKGPSPQPQ